MEKTQDHFSLKWSNFRSSLTEGFHDFLREEMMVDVTLAAEGKFVQAHKLVLSVCSPYFKNLFKVNPCKHPIVILKDVAHNELSYMLQFMYKGEVGVKHEDLSSFLKLAEMLKVKGLVEEKLENVKNNFSTGLESTMGKVRKKKSKNILSDIAMENNISQATNKKYREKKIIRSRKRRWSAKSESNNRIKCKKFEDESLDNNCVIVSDSDDENNPLVKLLGDKVNSGENSVKLDLQCDTKNSFDSVEEKDAVDNEDEAGEADDFNISSDFLPPVNLTETEQTPQGHLSSLIISRAPRAFVWDYFLKETHQAICLNCGKTFRGQRPNTICEQHLKRRHPEFYKILLEKKIKRAELHMNPMVMRLGIPSQDNA